MEIATATDVIAALRNPALPMDQDQIKTAWELLRHRHAQTTINAARSFAFGDRVSFEGRGGARLKGMVLKSNLKTVTVNVDGRQWRVSPSLLTME